MEFVKTFILICIINYTFQFLAKKLQKLQEIIKLKKSLKNNNFNNIDNDFWEDFNEEDVENIEK